MKKQPMRTPGLVAAGVVAGGIMAGTLGAQAADESEASDTDKRGVVMHVHRGPGGPGGADLAKALGVSEDKLRDAFEAIHDDVRPSRDAIKNKMTAALAKELGLSEAKVEAAFEKVHKAHAAERRDALSDRLDAAVEDGKLTQNDMASVLKAFDAGVLGGPRLR